MSTDLNQLSTYQVFSQYIGKVNNLTAPKSFRFWGAPILFSLTLGCVSKLIMHINGTIVYLIGLCLHIKHLHLDL